MQPLIQQFASKLRQISDWVDGIFGQGLIVVLAVVLAAAAGASA